MVILLFLLWNLLAGEVTLNTCLTGAAVSALLWYFGHKQFGYAFFWDGLPTRNLWGRAKYLCYLLPQMLKAGLVVMKLVYTKNRNMEPVLLYFRTDLQSAGARSLLANSITLTAGTITVRTEDDLFCVHSLDRSLTEGLDNSGFECRLKELERKP